jgi:hypothetical protein
MESAAQYKPISDYWIVNDDLLGFWKYKGTEVRIVSLPTLEELAPMSEAQAAIAGLCPTKHW